MNVELITILVTIRSILARVTSNLTLTILHTNDIHSHYDPTNEFGTDCTFKQIQDGNCFGGVGRLKAAVDKVRLAHPNTILVDAGDQFQGTLYYTYFKGNVTWEVMNELQYDAMSIGNHEFDNGPDNLARVIKKLKFPVLCANIDTSRDPKLNELIKPYVYLPDYDLAIIGFITETTGQLSNVGLSLKFTDPVLSVQNIINKLNARGIKRIIGLSHTGYKEDLDLVSHTRGLSLVIGGHSHSYLKPEYLNNLPYSYGPYPTITKNIDGQQVYIVQAYCWGRFLGHLDVTFHNNGYIETIHPQLIELTMDLIEDNSMLKLINNLKHKFEDLGNKVIGNATNDFTVGYCQFQECAMGNLLTDAMLFRHQQEHPDFAIFNSGGIRASFSEGPITMQNILAVLPFENYIVQLNLSGKEIWTMLNSIIKKFNPINSKSVTSFIQVSGMQFNYNSSSKSLLQVHIYNNSLGLLQPLDLNKTYKIITPDFIANGGDNFIFPPKLNFTRLELQSQGLIHYIASNSPIKPSLNNRIINIKNPIPIKNFYSTLANTIPYPIQFETKLSTYHPTSFRQVSFFRNSNQVPE